MDHTSCASARPSFSRDANGISMLASASSSLPDEPFDLGLDIVTKGLAEQRGKSRAARCEVNNDGT
jgi:hypothetical protein